MGRSTGPVNLSDPFLSEALAFAHALAEAARAEILPRFRDGSGVENKAGRGFDPVTAADRAAEAAMRALIEARFPEHGIEGEEFGVKPSASGYSWILDPIDGTRAFIAGAPSWGTLIALAHEGRPILGIIDQGYLNERYVGWPGGAEAMVRGARTPLRARACAVLTDALLATTDPHLFTPPELGAFEQVRAAARLTRFGLDCYAYALLALGHIDVVIESGLKPYDVAALIPVIEGAGGRVTNWVGGPAWRGGQVIASGAAAPHAEALVALRRSAV